LRLAAALTLAAPGALAPAPGADADVGQLFEQAAVEREGVEVVLAREVDAPPVAREARVRLRLDGARHLTPRAARVLVEVDVAVFGEHRPPLILRQVARRGRRVFRLVLGEFAQVRAVAVDDVSVHLFQARLLGPLPAKIDARAVLRPAHVRRRVTDERRAAHDAVDRQLEPPRLRRGRGDGGGRLLRDERLLGEEEEGD
jgi:hypothetical protein